MQRSPGLRWQRLLLFPFSNLFIVFYTFLLYSNRVYSSLESVLQFVFFSDVMQFYSGWFIPQYGIYPYVIDVAIKAVSNFLILIWTHSAIRQKKWNIYSRGEMDKHCDLCGSTFPHSFLAAVLKSNGLRSICCTC